MVGDPAFLVKAFFFVVTVSGDNDLGDDSGIAGWCPVELAEMWWRRPPVQRWESARRVRDLQICAVVIN